MAQPVDNRLVSLWQTGMVSLGGLVIAIVFSGCGRLGFEVPESDAASDSATDPDAADAPIFTCPAAYTRADTGCYRLGTGLGIPRSLKAADAELDCGIDGGHLAVIDSKAENDALTLFEGMTSAWIGVVDPGGGYVTITGGVPSTFEQWAPGDPNGEGNCVRLLETSGNWDDEICTRALAFLCEFDGRASVIAVP